MSFVKSSRILIVDCLTCERGSYYVGTAGNVSAATIQNYVNAQEKLSMLLAFKYRLQPNQEQRQVLERLLETHRRIYNDALKERIWAWRHQASPLRSPIRCRRTN